MKREFIFLFSPFLPILSGHLLEPPHPQKLRVDLKYQEGKSHKPTSGSISFKVPPVDTMKHCCQAGEEHCCYSKVQVVVSVFLTTWLASNKTVMLG